MTLSDFLILLAYAKTRVLTEPQAGSAAKAGGVLSHGREGVCGEEPWEWNLSEWGEEVPSGG